MPIDTGSNSMYDFYYTEEFKTLVRSQKEILLRQAGTQYLVDRNEVYMYRFDFYRLLRSLKIPPHFHWATAFLNGIEDPFADCSHLTEIRTVLQSQLEDIIVRKNTERG